MTFRDDAFADAATAWATVEECRQELFRTVAALDARGYLTGSAMLFVGGAGARGLGLSQALAREGRLNSHAVWPLLRALVDTVMVALEVRRHPGYADVVMHKPSEWELGWSRHSSQKLIARARAEAPGLKALWAFLSEGDHFGSLGFAQAVSSSWQAPDGTYSVILTSDPSHTSEKAHVVIAKHTATLVQCLTLILARIIAEQP